jgi:hypothetical protein
MKNKHTERKSGAPVRCSDLVRPSSFYQKLLGTLTWLNPMKYYQSWQNSRAWNRYYKWYAETEQYRSEAKLRRAQEQSDLANQTARVRLRSCIEFASGQKMELKDVEVDIPFPYFNGARWPNSIYWPKLAGPRSTEKIGSSRKCLSPWRAGDKPCFQWVAAVFGRLRSGVMGGSCRLPGGRVKTN